MIEGIEPLFQQIAESMVAGIPEDWSASEYHAIFFSESSRYEGEYVRCADSLPRSFQPRGDCDMIVRQLRERFRTAGQPLWGRVWFALHPDGSFNVRWGYDDCDADGNALFDAEAEFQRSESRRIRLTRVMPPRTGAE